MENKEILGKVFDFAIQKDVGTFSRIETRKGTKYELKIWDKIETFDNLSTFADRFIELVKSDLIIVRE
jgi:hypothetical protein